MCVSCFASVTANWALKIYFEQPRLETLENRVRHFLSSSMLMNGLREGFAKLVKMIGARDELKVSPLGEDEVRQVEEPSIGYFQ